MMVSSLGVPSCFVMTEVTVADIKGGTSVATRRSAASCEDYKDQCVHTIPVLTVNPQSKSGSFTLCDTEVTRPCVSNQPSVTF